MTSFRWSLFPSSTTHKSHGFNLIEAAIVLGVVGLVIGGIWTGAAAYQTTFRVNRAVEGILAMWPKLATLPSSISPSGGTNINSFAISANIPPKNWVRGSAIYDPWGGLVHIYMTNGYAGIHFQNLQQKHCINILNRLIGVMNSRTVNGVSVYDGATNTGYIWPQHATTTSCHTTNLVMIYFKPILPR